MQHSQNIPATTMSDSSSSLPPGVLEGGTFPPSAELLEWPPEPQEVTDWLVEFRLNASEPCPLGYVCEENRIANCTKIRAVALSFGFGDVHAGGYCPEGYDKLQLCPVGHYCPTAEEIYECPATWYCPYKTAFPEVNCWGCGVGEESLVREWYGYVILFVIFLLVIVYIMFVAFRRYQKNLYNRFVELRNRSLDSALAMYRRQQRLEDLERLRPKLFAIQQRLEQLEHDGMSQGSSGSWTVQPDGSVVKVTKEKNKTDPAQSEEALSASARSAPTTGLSINQATGKITYDAGRLFNALDENGNGKLDFDELQRVLELNPRQLQAFVQRMNELGDVSADAKEVTRPVFTKHFLSVLEETTNFGPTVAEVEDLFDHLAEDGWDVAAYQKFFDSRLTIFLSDPQINDLIALLRKAAEQEEGHGGGKNRRRSTLVGQQHEEPVDKTNKKTKQREADLDVERGLLPSLSRRGNFKKSGTDRGFSVASLLTGGGITGGLDTKRYVHHDIFVAHYADALVQVTSNKNNGNKSLTESGKESKNTTSKGIDLAFENLSLAVPVGDKKVNVVNNVSGRLQARTMTALMGGSGAGKTSLLNALCGRAFYGETTGTIRINGHVTSIEEHKDATGFVPQDDIVHAELSVRENLIYSGRFTLPKGTSREEIEDLADVVLANLGLSRVADSIVGDVNRRGVSGGEKKRVNIGVELMSRPSILFLDEPTSGLDSSSALLVMGSLKNLTENQGVTVLSVIHQPRKAIFDSFDSLVLLGVGGNMVYHGPVPEAQAYFSNLPQPYLLPPGESLADWLIDVSSGRLAPEEKNTSSQEGEDSDEYGVSPRGPSNAKFENSLQIAKERRQVLYDCWNDYYNNLDEKSRSRYIPPKPYALPRPVEKPAFRTQLRGQIQRNFLMTWRNRSSKLVDTTMIVGAVVLISWLQGVTEVTRGQQPDLSFDELVEGDPYEIPKTFPYLFKYALGPTAGAIEFALKIGVITSVLLGLTAAKALTGKRLEFFRESGSGWDINAYFLALNITSFMEHFFQMVLAALCSYWLRDSLTRWYSYQIQFIMLMWLTVSWSLLIPLVVPANNTVLAVGFFMAFFGLLFSGGIEPVTYKDIYEEGNGAMAVFSGTVSTTRYFIEGLTVAEQRCLPPQSGFPVAPQAINFPVELVGSFHLVGLAQNDLSVVQQSCNGWYWGVYPALAVGLSLRVLAGGVLHVSDRSKQAKKPLWHELKAQPTRAKAVVVLYIVLVCGMFAYSVYLILTPMGETGILPQPQTDEEKGQIVDMTIQGVLSPGSEGSGNGTAWFPPGFSG